MCKGEKKEKKGEDKFSGSHYYKKSLAHMDAVKYRTWGHWRISGLNSKKADPWRTLFRQWCPEDHTVWCERARWEPQAFWPMRSFVPFAFLVCFHVEWRHSSLSFGDRTRHGFLPFSPSALNGTWQPHKKEKERSSISFFFIFISLLSLFDSFAVLFHKFNVKVKNRQHYSQPWIRPTQLFMPCPRM